MRYIGVIGLALLGLLGCNSPGDTDPPHVLLITVDTLRADRLGNYGYPLATSPNIDELAATGTRFTDCTVQWPTTWPSMASMMTGAYPRTTGLRYRERRVIQPAMLLLSEVFAQAGYDTAAVVANFNLGARFGFDQGFATFVESWEEAWKQQAGDRPFENLPGKVKFFTDARVVTDQGLAWVRSLPDDRSFFLWLHYMDPHGPYLPPARYAAEFVGAYEPEPVALDALPRYQVQADSGTGEPITDLAHYRAQYDRQVRFLDDEIGRLLGELESQGIAGDRLMIVLAADHGESLGEHDYMLEHGMLPYQPAARIPLIVVQPGRVPAARSVERPVGLIDLGPTMLELAGLDVPATFEGDSLVPLLDGNTGAVEPRHVFMESGFEEQTQRTVREGRFKLVHVRDPADRQRMSGGAVELYDLESDPGELHNLAQTHPDVVARLSDVLDAWAQGAPAMTEQGEIVDLELLSPEEREMLRALGYLK